MRSRWLVWLGLLATILCCTGAAAQGSGDRPAAKRFMVFDATQYLHKPKLHALGIDPIYIAYEQHLFQEGDRARREPGAMPTADRFDSQILAARKSGSQFLIVDIEVWSVHGSRKNPKGVADSVARFEQTLTLARSRAQGMRIGLFGPLPLHSGYDRLIAPVGSEAHAEMVADNDKLFKLASMVDAMFPVGYTLTADRAEWEFAVAKQISEARRLRKDVPVYVFLWPQYADYGPSPKDLRHRWLPADYWRFQLDKIHEIADGVVIWGGWDLERGRRWTWDEQAPWWQETREFMRDKGLKRPNAPVLNR